ncbi:hypothetical protein FACS1894219_02580 [Clostridia bacterium]|nr:hypothetical protein FACS1894219_02580 [Clostridia bacterium]
MTTIRRYLTLNDKKTEKAVFIFCWIAYFSVYTGRYNFSAALAQMTDEGFISSAEGGLIASFFFFAYGFGHIIAGFLGDRTSPFMMIGLGMSVSAALNLSMMIAPENAVPAMCVIWGLNGLSQSVIWSPIVRIFSQLLSEERRFKASVNINTTVPAGILFTYLLSAALLSVFTWRSVFAAAGIILTAVSVAWFSYYFSVRKKFVLTSDPVEAKHDSGKRVTGKISGGFIAVVLLILTLPVVWHGMLKDSITTLFPVYLQSEHNIPPNFAVLLTTFLPLINLTGVYAAKAIYTKVRQKELITCAWLFAATAVSFAAMFLVGRFNPYIATILAAVGTSSMFGVNSILVSVLPMSFGASGYASTVTGVLNAVTYIGVGISTIGIGSISEKAGWLTTIAAWAVLAAAGAGLCFVLNRPWGKRRPSG